MIRALASLLLTAALTSAAFAATPAPPADSAAAPTVTDYSGYQSLLDEFLVVISKKGEPLDTRFDYERLYDIRSRRARMVRTLSQLLAVPPSRMDEKSRRAWAINTYNFAVIDLMTENLLVPGRKRLRYKSVQDLRFSGMPFFRAPAFTVEGKKYSLDEFERTFVFGGYRPALGTPTPQSVDPRAHFALVRGSLGDAPLQPRAFRAESLDIQLEQATRNAMRLPRVLRWSDELGSVEVSEVFNANAGDFDWHEHSLEFVTRYAPGPIQSEIRKKKPARIGGYLPWDWNLNQAPGKPANRSS